MIITEDFANALGMTLRRCERIDREDAIEAAEVTYDWNLTPEEVELVLAEPRRVEDVLRDWQHPGRHDRAPRLVAPLDGDPRRAGRVHPRKGS